jgi:hypothetical protein
VAKRWLLAPTSHHLHDLCLASDRFELETDSAVDRSRRRHARRLLPKRPDTRPCVHLCPREPQQAAQLLHRYLLRQVPPVLYACYDFRHGVSSGSPRTVYRLDRGSPLRLLDQDLAGTRRRTQADKHPCFRCQMVRDDWWHTFAALVRHCIQRQHRSECGTARTDRRRRRMGQRVQPRILECPWSRTTSGRGVMQLHGEFNGAFRLSTHDKKPEH